MEHPRTGSIAYRDRAVERTALRIGVYSDLVYRRDADGFSANRSFIRFVTALAPQARELVLFGRVDPEPGRAPYAVPSAARVAALPYYRSARDLPALARALAGSCRTFWRELGRLLEHASALLRADPDQQLWNPLARALLYEIADRLEELGRLDLTSLSLGAVAAWMARFSEGKSQEPDWLRERGVWLNDHGDVLRAQGDLAGALSAYQQALELSTRLAQADPSNASWQRDVSVSHNKVGDVLSDQGDLAGALSAYQQALALSTRLAQAGPSNASWQRDLSVALNRLAQLHEQQGARLEALAFAEESLAIAERLAALDSTNATWQKDLAFTRAQVARLRGGAG